MAQTKINYGIDLGTTNSALAKIENGKQIIIKTDVQKDTMPSCVGFNKKKSILAGESAWNGLKQDKLRAVKTWDNKLSNFFIEFKRTMGTSTKKMSSYMEKEYNSEELSSEILKKLKSFESDKKIQSIVITVPAKFTINQKDATRRAGELAGFMQVELLQEPIAASMAYGLDAKIKNGHWLVFDFGGGTFDAALVRVEEGIMQVIDTEGDNYLGGKNLDYAIVNEIIIPYLKENYTIESILADDSKKEILQDAMKYYAEEAKIQLSFNETHSILSDLGDIPGEDDEGEEFELDITVNRDDIKKVLGSYFQKAIDLSKELLQRNNLTGQQLETLLLVGGPTYSTILRDMLEEQICKPDTSVDPMTVVAKGAALYASTIDIADDIVDESRDRTKIQLKIEHETSTVETQEFVTVKTEPEKTEGAIPNIVYAEVTRSDKSWSSGKVQINNIGEVLEVQLNEGTTNAFYVQLFDEQGNKVPCEPNSFSIIQGSKVGSATLPYHIGIEIKSSSKEKFVFQTIEGLQKNKSIPATGIINGLKTQQEIRPGIKDDFIKVPIYQGNYHAEGTPAIYNEHVYDVIITGDDLPSLLQKGSPVDVTLKVDRSEKMTLSAFFPTLEETVDITVPEIDQKSIEENYLEQQIEKARQTANMLEEENAYDKPEELKKLKEEVDELKQRFNERRTDDDRKKNVLDSLKQKMIKLDEIEEHTKWPKTEEELKDVFYRLEKAQKEHGDEKTDKVVSQFRAQIPEVIQSKNGKLARQMIDDMRSLSFDLVSKDVRFWVGFIYHFNESFDTLPWSDKNKARVLIDQGLKICTNNPTEEKLRPVIAAIYQLLPDVEKDNLGLDDKSLLSD